MPPAQCCGCLASRSVLWLNASRSVLWLNASPSVPPPQGLARQVYAHAYQASPSVLSCAGCFSWAYYLQIALSAYQTHGPHITFLDLPLPVFTYAMDILSQLAPFEPPEDLLDMPHMPGHPSFLAGACAVTIDFGGLFKVSDRVTERQSDRETE
jgi:hypothetical protein